ncbi:hypothetical protein LR48_Vigan03g135300 [Vigna angularis]|uniref:Uncharacterized protein n=1 Tax=Phaseolus angularis TaxID=3914 RepID=A0A0L9U5D5_PHAAN|nr:hypothetical protein LR48_Vigan03g135300 [Vigna angularis]
MFLALSVPAMPSDEKADLVEDLGATGLEGSEKFGAAAAGHQWRDGAGRRLDAKNDNEQEASETTGSIGRGRMGEHWQGVAVVDETAEGKKEEIVGLCK